MASSRKIFSSFLFLVTLISFHTDANQTHAQTALDATFQVQLRPEARVEMLQGIDSQVGKIVNAGVPEIQFEIGRITPPGEPALGGDFQGASKRVPETKRLWNKTSTINSFTFEIVYTDDDQLFVSTTADNLKGILFSSVAHTPEEIIDVVLVALSVQAK